MRMVILAATTAATLVALSTAVHADIQIVNQTTKQIYVYTYYVPSAGASLTECGYDLLQAGDSVTVNHAAQCQNKEVSLYARSPGAPVGTGCELHRVSWANGRLLVTGNATMSTPLRCSP